MILTEVTFRRPGLETFRTRAHRVVQVYANCHQSADLLMICQYEGLGESPLSRDYQSVPLIGCESRSIRLDGASSTAESSVY